MNALISDLIDEELQEKNSVKSNEIKGDLVSFRQFYKNEISLEESLQSRGLRVRADNDIFYDHTTDDTQLLGYQRANHPDLINDGLQILGGDQFAVFQVPTNDIKIVTQPWISPSALKVFIEEVDGGDGPTFYNVYINIGSWGGRRRQLEGVYYRPPETY